MSNQSTIYLAPHFFDARERTLLIEEPFLVIEGKLQNVDNVVNVSAERVRPLRELLTFDIPSHDFH